MAQFKSLSTIDDSTVFDEVWVGIIGTFVSKVIAVDTSQVGLTNYPVAAVLTTTPGRTSPVDSSHESYDIAKEAVINGDAVLKYLFPPHGNSDKTRAYLKDDVPVKWQHYLRHDTFGQSIESAEQQALNVSYADLTFYQYIDGVAVVITPSFSDGDVQTLIDSMETNSWYLTIADANVNRGANTVLRTCVVSYEYVGDTDTSTVNINLVPAGGVRYSTDGGITFNELVPADTTTITHLEITIGGESIDFPVNNETQELETTLVDGHAEVQGAIFPAYTFIGYTNTWSLAGGDLSRYYALFFHAFKAPSWSDVNNARYGGFSAPIPISLIQTTAPGLIRWGDVNNVYSDAILYDKYYYRLSCTKSSADPYGQVDVTLVDVDEDTGISSDDRINILFCFESYPVTKFTEGVTSSATVVKLFGTRRGISIGDILYAGQEQMKIEFVGDSYFDFPIVVTDLIVNRAANGTTAVSHEVDKIARVKINSDRIRNFVYLRQWGLSSPFRVKVFGLKKYREVVV